MSDVRIALVTGASRGIGLAIAKTLAMADYQVVGTATQEAGIRAIDALNEQGATVMSQICDVTDQAAVKALQVAIEEKFGRSPDILVCNAGITRDNLMLRMKDEEWNQVIATNLTANFHLMQLFLRSMLKKRWGRIVAVGSVSGHMGNPGQANYAAAKAGLVGLCKSLAREVASRGITVNVVAPGFIETDMTADIDEAITQVIPMGRKGNPEEIAQAVRFLVSLGAAYITGETLHVNGGMAML